MTLLAPLAMKAVMEDGCGDHHPQRQDQDQHADEPISASDAGDGQGEPHVGDEQPHSEDEDETDLGPHEVAHVRTLRRTGSADIV